MRFQNLLEKPSGLLWNGKVWNLLNRQEEDKQPRQPMNRPPIMGIEGDVVSCLYENAIWYLFLSFINSRSLYLPSHSCITILHFSFHFYHRSLIIQQTSK